MNKVFLIGNLTRDIELKRTQSDIAFCNFSIAVKGYSDDVNFFNVTAWRAQAENCAKYLKKGSKVAVSGALQNNTYESNDGIKRTQTVVIASDVEFLTPKNTQAGDSFSSSPVDDLEPVEEEGLPF